MPISLKVLAPRNAEAGKVKIGRLGVRKRSEKGKEFSQPLKLETKEGPYFLVTKTTRSTGEDSNFVLDAALMKALEEHAERDSDGKLRLRQIPIMLDSDALDEIAPHYLALYRGTSLFCSGTGEGEDAATRWEESVPQKVECPCNFLRARQGEKCKPNLTLWFTIVAGVETRLGVRHAFRTTGWNSIKSILGGLETIQAQVGTICGIRLWLCVKWDLKKDGTGTTRRVPVVYVECRTNDLMNLRREAIAGARARLELIQLQNPVALALPAPAQGESKATQAHVAAEWYPPSAESDPEEEDDDEFYDPETGEVYTPENRSADPLEDETHSEIPGDEVLPEPHPVRETLKKLLTEVALSRNFSDDDLVMARREIWVEACESASLSRLPWRSLTTNEAQRIESELRGLIHSK